MYFVLFSFKPRVVNLELGAKIPEITLESLGSISGIFDTKKLKKGI